MSLLKKGMLLAVVTDAPAREAWLRLCGLGFHHLFHVGVTFDDDGTMHTERASREVILSAGAYCSPQLLMLSGVGAPEELAKFQIDVVHPLPGVGKNLQEHFDAAVLVRSKDHGGISITAKGGMQMTVEGVKYYGAHLGKLRSSVTEAGSAISHSSRLRTVSRVGLSSAARVRSRSSLRRSWYSAARAGEGSAMARPAAVFRITLPTRPGR